MKKIDEKTVVKIVLAVIVAVGGIAAARILIDVDAGSPIDPSPTALSYAYEQYELNAQPAYTYIPQNPEDDLPDIYAEVYDVFLTVK